MALLAFATFAASVASAQTYSGKITSSDWSGKGLESDVDYSLTYIESTKKLNFEFTVPCDKKSMLHISLQSMALVKLQ